eukprot:TRINITY_DN57221_c0_g1_i1.p1 TRINITY_DN57221_c0_g1~~TRINITY_DN57221_c0_g1_i1.p1  ORF type:complete len:295 (-),score=47.26 TRINITY_DN57221_c0_g1_i1:31-915(-)
MASVVPDVRTLELKSRDGGIGVLVRSLAARCFDAACANRACTWAGTGVALCGWGARLRYTALFFPIFRVANIDDVAAIGDHLTKVGEHFMSTPVGLHPSLWRTAQALAMNIFSRSINLSVFSDVVCSGAIVSAALGLAEDPSVFISLKFAAWLDRMADGATRLRRSAASRAGAVVHDVGGSPRACFVAQIGAAQLVGFADMWVSARVQQLGSVVVNCTLGAQLLRSAAHDVFPEPGFAVDRLLDGLCVGVAFAGLYKQAREHRVLTRLAVTRTRIAKKFHELRTRLHGDPDGHT